MAKLTITFDTDTNQIEINEPESSLQKVDDVLLSTVMSARLFSALYRKTQDLYKNTTDPDMLGKINALTQSIRGIMSLGG